MSSPAAPERILLVRLSAMGDVLQALFALRSLRAARPDAEIGWAVERRFASLVEGHPALDRLFVLERDRSAGLGANVGAFARLRAEIRAWRPDVAVDLQGNLRGALVARASGAARRIALPHGEAREGAQHLGSERVPAAEDPREHRAERALRLVAPLVGATPPDVSSVPLLPPLPDAAREIVAAGLARVGVAARRFALFVAGTSDFGAFKRWPPERFGALARRLATEGGSPVLVSFGPGQEILAGEIAAASGGTAQLAPRTGSLHELRALLDAAGVVIGADSGPVVLAGMMDRPTVVLFGPKDPAVYAPRGAAVESVWKGVYCSPCTLRRCDDPICMTELSEDEAWAGILRAVSRSRAAGAVA